MSVLASLICPESSPAEEHVEAERKEATRDYAGAVPDSAVRPVVAPFLSGLSRSAC